MMFVKARVGALGVHQRKAHGLTWQRQWDSGTGEVLFEQSGFAEVFVWGGGGSGDNANTGRAGGGGGASYRLCQVLAGQKLSFAIGAGGAGAASPSYGSAGGTTIVRCPDGVRFGATGGLGGGTLAGAGGTGFGGDRNRTGGSGGQLEQVGFAGEFGGVGGNSSHGGGGGGAAGFTDIGEFLTGGAGGRGVAIELGPAPGRPGGGSGGSSGSSASGAPGRVLVLFYAD